MEYLKLLGARCVLLPVYQSLYIPTTSRAVQRWKWVGFTCVRLRCSSPPTILCLGDRRRRSTVGVSHLCRRGQRTGTACLLTRPSETTYALGTALFNRRLRLSWLECGSAQFYIRHRLTRSGR